MSEKVNNLDIVLNAGSITFSEEIGHEIMFAHFPKDMSPRPDKPVILTISDVIEVFDTIFSGMFVDGVYFFKYNRKERKIPSEALNLGLLYHTAFWRSLRFRDISPSILESLNKIKLD